MKEFFKEAFQIKNILPSALTGLGVALSAAPWDIFPLAFISLIPWLICLDRHSSSLSKTVWSSLWAGFFMALGTFSWVSYVLNHFGGLPWVLAILFTLLFAFGAEPQFLVFGLVRRHLKRSPYFDDPILCATVCAITYTGIDFLVPKLFQDTLGHALHTRLPFLQNAEWGGAHALTFMLVFFNESVLVFLRDRKLKHLIAPLILCHVFYGYGLIRIKQIQKLYLENGKTLVIAGVQGNIGDFEKLAAEKGVRDAADQVLHIFKSMTDEAIRANPKTDWVIWPETTYPSAFGTPYTLSEARRDQDLIDYSEKIGRPILFGGYDRKNNLDYNAFFYLEPKTIEPKIGPDAETRIQVYHKNILLYFGEELPFSNTFPILKKWFPQVANFGRGPGPQVISVRAPNRYETIRTTPVICYEALFPEFILKGANAGAQLIINATNDSWFGPWGEPELHFSLTKFRSVETRLPQFRVTNSGISALILPTGEVARQTKTFEPIAFSENVVYLNPERIPKTLMKRFPNGFAWLCVTLLVGFGVLVTYRPKKILPI